MEVCKWTKLKGVLGCARFPFCDIHPEFCDHEKNWIKRPSDLKLENYEDGNFDFEEIKWWQNMQFIKVMNF